jgi:phosphate transport system protein
MLADDRVVFDLAMSILLDGVDWKSVRREIKATDQRVNEGEREIRRDLVVHASVVGAIDTPAILVYMSIVKDIERIGDYGKNLRDLGRTASTCPTSPPGTSCARRSTR